MRRGALAVVVAISASGLGACSQAPPQPAADTDPHIEVSEGTSIAVAASPDGRTLVFDLQGMLWTLPAAGGRATRITDDLGDARQPAWSPDGQTIAFQSFRDGMWHLWGIAPDGTGLRQLTSGAFDDREPNWSHDGRRLAFASDRSGNYDVWELELASGTLTQRTKNPTHDFNPAWSLDDAEIAFVSDRQPAGVWAIGSGDAERSVSPAAGAGVPSWRPGGGVLHYRVSGEASQLVLDGQPATTNENVFPFRPQWLTATQFVYTADGKIKKRTIGTADAEVVPFTAAIPLAPRAAYTRRPYDFDARTPRPARGIVGPTIAPDGQRLAFAALGDIWTMKIGEAPVRVTHDAAADLDPAWSPDGTRLAFSSDRTGVMALWIRDLRTGADRRLTKLETSAMAPVWSPDGRRIAFHDSSGLFGADLSLVDVASGVVSKVRPGLFGPSRVTWSPRGDVLMMSALVQASSRFREGTNQLLAVTLKGPAEQFYAPLAAHSLGPRHGGEPVWSPDGTRVAFVMDGALWTVPVDGSGRPTAAPAQLTREMSDSPSWAGNSREILYLHNEQLKIVAVDTGDTRDVPLALSYAPPAPPTGRIVVHAGRFFDGAADGPQENVDVTIEGNRIRDVKPHSADAHAGTVVDASASTVLPGLIESHGHPFPEYGEPIGRAWLSYGVTTVRNPGGTAYGSVEIREAIDSGTRLGPRVFTAGYQIDGSRIYYPLSAAIRTPEHLTWELMRAGALGHDLVKTYVRLPDELQRQAVGLAHRMGIPVTSHELYPAVTFGADGTEHTSGTSRRGYSPKVGPLGWAYQDVVDLLVKGQMSMSPTVSLGRFAAMAAEDQAIVDDERLRFLFPRWVGANLRANVERFRSGTQPRRGGGPEGARDTVRRLIGAGGLLVAGTDSPITPYGSSLHAEIAEYVAAGVSPAAALKTATSTAARVLGLDADLGTLAPGKLADLIIVDGDPFADIHTTRNVRTVIKNGQVLERTVLLPPQATRAAVRAQQ